MPSTSRVSGAIWERRGPAHCTSSRAMHLPGNKVLKLVLTLVGHVDLTAWFSLRPRSYACIAWVLRMLLLLLVSTRKVAYYICRVENGESAKGSGSLVLLPFSLLQKHVRHIICVASTAPCTWGYRCYLYTFRITVSEGAIARLTFYDKMG